LRAQQRAERRAVRPGEEKLKRDDEDCKWESGWSEEEVDGDNVHDDRREHSQRERHEAVGQERGPRDRIRPKKQREEVPLATSPPMNSAAAPFIVGSGNQCKNPFRPKTKKTRPKRTRATKTALDLMVKKMLPAAADHLLHSAAVSRTKSSYRLGAWPISEVSVATSALLGAKPRSSYPWNISRRSLASQAGKI